MNLMKWQVQVSFGELPLIQASFDPRLDNRDDRSDDDSTIMQNVSFIKSDYYVRRL